MKLELRFTISFRKLQEERIGKTMLLRYAHLVTRLMEPIKRNRNSYARQETFGTSYAPSVMRQIQIV